MRTVCRCYKQRKILRGPTAVTQGEVREDGEVSDTQSILTDADTSRDGTTEYDSLAGDGWFFGFPVVWTGLIGDEQLWIRRFEIMKMLDLHV
jgi:hypothetical protein